MSEPNQPRKEGGESPPPKPEASDVGLTKTGADDRRDALHDQDRAGPSREKPGGMAGEG